MRLPCIRVVLTIVTRWIPQLLLPLDDLQKKVFIQMAKTPGTEPLWGCYMDHKLLETRNIRHLLSVLHSSSTVHSTQKIPRKDFLVGGVEAKTSGPSPWERSCVVDIYGLNRSQEKRMNILLLTFPSTFLFEVYIINYDNQHL